MNPGKTDEQLLDEFRAGRRAALGELAGRYERPLLGLACGLLGGRRDLAADAVQETWVRVIRFAGQFMGRSTFKTWLYRVAVNQCHTLQANAGAAAADPALAERPQPAASKSPLETAEQNHSLHGAVARLDPDRRLVVLLCYHGGMTHEQAAEILEIPLGTLKSRLHAALTELRARLGAEDRP